MVKPTVFTLDKVAEYSFANHPNSHFVISEIVEPLRNGKCLLVAYRNTPEAFMLPEPSTAQSAPPTNDEQKRFGRDSFRFAVWVDETTNSLKAVGLEDWGELQKRTMPKGQFCSAGIMPIDMRLRWDSSKGVADAIRASDTKVLEMICFAPTRLTADSVEHAQTLVARHFLKDETKPDHFKERANSVLNGELLAGNVVTKETSWLEKYGEMMKSVPPYRF
jgi:hypothetical protein